jgi:hypothetical protein
MHAEECRVGWIDATHFHADPSGQQASCALMSEFDDVQLGKPRYQVELKFGSGPCIVCPRSDLLFKEPSHSTDDFLLLGGQHALEIVEVPDQWRESHIILHLFCAW